MEKRCKFWLSKKNRFCANAPVKASQFCGNHKPDSYQLRVPCPIDPSHSILQENLEVHVKICPAQKQVVALHLQPFFKKGVNCGKDDEIEYLSPKSIKSKISCSKSYNGSSDITSEMKRSAIYEMSVPEFCALLRKIQSIYCSLFSNVEDSIAMPDALDKWMKRQADRQLPFQEKHILQQASILGNMEALGMVQMPFNLVDQDNGGHLCCDKSTTAKIKIPAGVEFGAGRGYLTQMLTDYCGIQKVFLVDRKSYKLKADRSLRQNQQVEMERLRIDIEDLDLDAVESLRGNSFLAIGKHLCGSATDLTLRCCLPEQHSESMVDSGRKCILTGLALATCCHHLCQWKHYINKGFWSELGISKDDFHALTWFTSWAVDADHGSVISDVVNQGLHNYIIENNDSGMFVNGVEEIVRSMKAVDRAVIGLICKEIIDIGRLMWLKKHGLEARLVKYIPANVSPENHLLIAKGSSV